ncbi:MAG: hypothetical protein QNJ27_05010 [Simkaniaceae bacterium]|nr:hypothetical protein [Simkaniaceae bacterium]
MYLGEDGDRVLRAKNAGLIEMTDTQYKTLKLLCDKVDTYDSSDERPENDKEIVNTANQRKVSKAKIKKSNEI